MSSGSPEKSPRTSSDVRTELSRPENHTWYLPTADGPGAALWAGVGNSAGHEHVFTIVVARADVDDEIGRQALEFLIEAGHRLAPEKGIHCGTTDNDEQLIRWFEAAGGVPVRKFGRMDIDLDPADPPEAPELPESVTLRTVEDTPEDWRILYDVIDTSFADHFGHVQQTYEEYVAEDRPWVTDYSLCWVASVDGQPAAALLGKKRPRDGYIGVLGTLKQFRGRGLARLLLRTAFAEFAQRGETRASLNVDLTNPTGAVHVYTSAGMRHTQTWVAYEWQAATA